MEPAQTIIRKLGGPSAVAKIVGVHRTRVSSWQRERARGGTGGRIPQNHISAMLAYAREQNIPLAPDEFYSETPPTSPAPSSDETVEVGS
jgi:hypothetical protein